MNRTTKKQILGVTTALALAIGLYAVGDGYAHSPWGHQSGRAGHTMMGPGMMMANPQGTASYQRMEPGMMGNQSSPYGFRGMGPGMTGGPMGFTKPTTDTTAIETYLANLKTRLGITTAQETAWNAYAETIKTQNTIHTNIYNTMHRTVLDNPLDRTDQHLTAMEKMVGQNKAVFQAFRTLYDQLDEKQRMVANQLSWPCHS